MCVRAWDHVLSVAMTTGRGEGGWQTQGEGGHHHGPLWGPRCSIASGHTQTAGS